MILRKINFIFIMQKNNKNRNKYFTYIVLFTIFFMIQVTTIILSWMYGINYFGYKIAILSICIVFLFLELLFTVCVAWNLKNSNYRNHYPFFIKWYWYYPKSNIDSIIEELKRALSVLFFSYFGSKCFMNDYFLYQYRKF